MRRLHGSSELHTKGGEGAAAAVVHHKTSSLSYCHSDALPLTALRLAKARRLFTRRELERCVSRLGVTCQLRPPFLTLLIILKYHVIATIRRGGARGALSACTLSATFLSTVHARKLSVLLQYIRRLVRSDVAHSTKMTKNETVCLERFLLALYRTILIYNRCFVRRPIVARSFCSRQRTRLEPALIQARSALPVPRLHVRGFPPA